MVDLLRSLTFPFTSTKNAVNFLIFAFLNTFWYFLLPLLVVNGYVVKTIRSAIEGENEMPDWPGFKWANWGVLIKYGLFYTIVLFIYLAVPFFVAYLISLFGFSLIFVLLWLLFFAVTVFILPMVLVSYAATESIVEAFNIPEIFGRMAQNIKQYIFVYFISAVLCLVGLTLAFFVPVLAGLFLAYPTIVSMHAFGQILEEAQ